MPRSARKEGFSRRHRFAAHGSFGAVLRQDRKLRGRHMVIHVTPGIAGASRLGIALARRLVASSVHRNRLKRVVREAFRRHAVKASGLDLVVTLRERFDPDSTRAIVAELHVLLDKLRAGVNG